MPRLLALLLIAALLAPPAVVSSLHAHVTSEHDHPEHHHGPAAHGHEATPVRADDGEAHLERCVPASHARPLAFTAAAPPLQPLVDANFTLPFLTVPALPVGRAARPADARAHSPPLRSRAAPRAPPLNTPA